MFLSPYIYIYISFSFLFSYVHRSPILAFSLFNYRQKWHFTFHKFNNYLQIRASQACVFSQIQIRKFSQKAQINLSQIQLFLQKNCLLQRINHCRLLRRCSSSSSKKKQLLPPLLSLASLSSLAITFVFFHKFVIEFRGVHELVQVGFMPNPNSTHTLGEERTLLQLWRNVWLSLIEWWSGVRFIEFVVKGEDMLRSS